MSVPVSETDQAECERCRQLEQLLAESEQTVKELALDRAGLEVQLRRAARAESAVRNELRQQQEADPKSQEIRAVLDVWAARHPKAAVPMDGERAKLVRRALRWGYSVQQLQTALHGLAMLPFVGPTGRMAHGTKAQRYDDVKHALRDESTIERFIAYATAPSTRPEPSASGQRQVRPRRMMGDPVPRILGQLQGVKDLGGDRWTARCPAHHDRHASLSVARGEKGVVVTCHAGCTAEDIATAVAIPIVEWFTDDPADEPTQRWSNPPQPAAQTAPPADADPLPDEQTIQTWQQRLRQSPALLERLEAVRGWKLETLDRLGVGWDGQRVVFPVRDPVGQLINVCRYLPNGKPKMLGLKHRERGFFPAPEALHGEVWIVEGEPDAVTAHQIGLQAVGLPGVNGWRKTMPDRLTGRHVVLCLDCDDPGRKAARALVEHLAGVAAAVRVVDLDPDRTDGYDLSDAVRDGATLDSLKAMAMRTAAIHDLRLIA